MFSPLAVLWLLALAVCASRLRGSSGGRRAVWVAATAAMSLLLGLHLLPGFSNPVIFRNVVLSRDAQPYSQYFNVDKGLGGFIFLGFSGWRPMRSAAEWRAALRLAVPFIVATPIVMMAASLALGYVRFDPHWTPFFWVWAPINLLLTCVSEEAFFRGLLQAELNRVLRSRAGSAVAVMVSALSFGLAHIGGGWVYAMLASVAGMGYALVYQRTGRLEMSILTHFSLNALHFLLFTYPALA